MEGLPERAALLHFWHRLAYAGRNAGDADARRTVRFSQRTRPKACGAARPAGRPDTRGRAVCALLHLRQKHQGGAAHRRWPQASRYRGAALRFHRARRQRRRVRQHHFLLECRRSGRGGRSPAANAGGARDPHRSQPRRRGGARRRASHPGSACGGDHRRAVRSGARRRVVRRARAGHRRQGRSRGHDRRQAFQGPPQLSRRMPNSRIWPSVSVPFTRRC